MKKTPLNEVHRELGARMVEFAGWDMPVQYESALKEHLAVRQAAGLFDVSHMGQLEMIGTDALQMIQKVTCNDAARLADGQAQYSAFLYPEGTFVDDIVVYRMNAEHMFICINAANISKDFEWVKAQQEGDVEIHNRSDQYAQLAIQGPQALSILQELVEIELPSIKRYWFAFGKVDGTEALISRTGYTGEDGFELYIAAARAESIWRKLLKAGESRGLTPAGLAARNTLRLEACYALYGHDIDNTTTPWEADLGWIVKLNKGEFIGKHSLVTQKEAGVKQKLAALEMVDRGIARDGFPVYLGGKQIGQVTSGTFSPSLQRSIGLAYVPAAHAGTGQELDVDIRGKRLKAKVVEKPFYQRK